jgi:molecular chaperone DnaK (HSP70)
LRRWQLSGLAATFASAYFILSDLLEPPPPSRYVVGIDLGTTNSAVGYVDTHQTPWQVLILAVPQLVASGQVEARETLPSFHYQPAEGEAAGGVLQLPWQRENPSHIVGIFARDHGARAPGRMIASAKSWLSHSGVDRTADILPWQAASDVDRLSPVEVSARYLRHIREAWDNIHPKEPLAQQEIVLTLPASFDEVARELTVEAAARAGLARVVLIEEPQAAFYAWLNKHAANWEQLVSPGQKILVCDIGGGTSDFTLIRVRRGDAGKVQFHRVAVGEHLILGGDNLDLALARYFEPKLAAKGSGGGRLDPRQFDVLVRICRQVKETLLGPSPPEAVTISLPGSGSKLIAGALQTQATREEVRSVLLDGFLPPCGFDDKPIQRRSGFQEFGLPYAPDAAITRYLAAFLTAHRFAGDEQAGQASSLPGKESSTGELEACPALADPARPDIVLFNGGMFDSPAMQQRLLEVLTSWFNREAPHPDPLPKVEREPAWQPIVLENDRLDLAVARGAAYYGMVRRGEGVRITARLARTYYLGVESDPPAALCVIPGSAEAGQDFELKERPLDLVISEPVEFPLYVSSIRLADRPGEMIPIDREQMTPLPPIRTAMRTRRKSERGHVPVHLHARLTEIGTLELWCSEIDLGGRGSRRALEETGASYGSAGASPSQEKRTWRLQFDVRSATQTDLEASETTGEQQGMLEETAWNAAYQILAGTFGRDGADSPEGLPKRLAEALSIERGDWPPSLLRRIWEALIELEPGRRKGPVHEARWLNLLGYALRPGYGVAVDDWRVGETWRLVAGKLAHQANTSRTESLILWRRIGGGLTSGQQKSLAEPLLGAVRALQKRFTSGGTKGGDGGLGPHEANELLRLLGSLELLPLKVKGDLGNALVGLFGKKKLEAMRGAMLWTVGRLGARVPLYGPLNTVVAPEVAARWIEALVADSKPTDPMLAFAVIQLARRTGDRYRDVNEASRQLAVNWLTANDAAAHHLELVRDGGQLDSDEAGRVFGESLPKGLRLR